MGAASVVVRKFSPVLVPYDLLIANDAVLSTCPRPATMFKVESTCPFASSRSTTLFAPS